MHPNPIFHTATADANLAFARTRSFGTLAIDGGDGGPLLAHVPFALHADGAHADLHLVRSNPIARALGTPRPAVIAVSGPDGYVSPDWYGLPDQVPTWNYVAVHLRGTLTRLGAEEMRAILDRQSADYEARLLPKTPWTADKMTPDALDRLMRQIVPLRFALEGVDGTWKLGQNKVAAARLSAATALAESGVGQEVGALAALMRSPAQG